MNMGPVSLPPVIRHLAIPVLILLAIASGAVAQVQPPDYDFQWRTVGAPGNRATNQQEAPGLFGPGRRPLGAVDYEFRMSRTEVTVGQWFEFINAYWPYFDGSPLATTFHGRWIIADNLTPGQNPQYRIAGPPEAAQFGTEASWRLAARYCNWLHNNKANTPEAFEQGAYDTSTFTQNPDGSFNDQVTHSPGARYWIPTLDEWTKGMYYSPDRYGPGEEGYWRQPAGQDAPLTPGLPQDGGQTTAGMFIIDPLPVGSYPMVQSPWGLWDGSGSLSEWTEEFNPSRRSRALKGTAYGDPSLFDAIDNVSFFVAPSGSFSTTGFRIASQVPTPGPVVVIGLMSALGMLHRKRK